MKSPHLHANQYNPQGTPHLGNGLFCLHLFWLLIRIKGMEQKLQQIFKKIQEIEPSTELKEAVLLRIEKEEAKKLRFKLMASRLISVFSMFTAVAVFLVLGKEFLNSEFMKMLSLMFSDLEVVAGHWNDFALSLMETFPVAVSIAILVPLFTFFLSLGSYLDIHNIKHKYI